MGMYPRRSKRGCCLSMTHQRSLWRTQKGRFELTGLIYFNISEARGHLSKNGQVYTIRKERATGITYARYGDLLNFNVLGKVKIKLLLQLSSDQRIAQLQLCEFVPESGFIKVQEWLCNVKRWHDQMFLYHVGCCIDSKRNSCGRNPA